MNEKLWNRLHNLFCSIPVCFGRFPFAFIFLKNRGNKKVLLRERNRHTDRGVSSTPYTVLSGGEGVGTFAGGG